MTIPGLCAHCIHARTIQNDRGSVFWLCEASKFNPKLSKYPRMPVSKCEEYQKQENEPHFRGGVHLNQDDKE
jgi:hypothetical protein